MKKLGILLILFTLCFWQESSYAQGSNLVGPAGIDCKKFTGLVNRIVQCVSHLTSTAILQKRIQDVHDFFVGASTAAVVIYIMFFGLKAILGGVKKFKSEAFMVFITAFFIIYMNNSVRIYDMLRLFMLAQTEFVNAATSAIGTQVWQDTNQDGEKQESELSMLPCQGPYDVATKTYVGDYTIWQRVDCVIAYVFGAHPIVQYVSNVSDSSENLTKEESEDPSHKFSTEGRSFELFKEIDKPFENMAEDPFEYLKENGNISKDHEIKTGYALLAIIAGLAVSDKVGLTLTLTGLFVVVLICVAFGQAALVYITALFAIAILALFAPIIIPTFLFQPTRKIFDFWLQMLITYTLQPAIMLSYLTFMVFVIQYVMDYTGCFSYVDKDKNMGKKCFSFIDMQTKFFQSASISSSPMFSSDRLVEEAGREIQQDNQKSMAGTTDTDDGENSNVVVVADAKKAEGETSVEVFGEDNAIVETSGDIGSTRAGSQSNFINKTEFDWTGDKKKLSEDLQTYFNTMNKDGMFNSLRDNGKLESMMDEIKESENIHNMFSLAYMHMMLVIFLVISLTFAFMNNVIAFGDALAGAGTQPINQMVSIYNKAAARIDKSAQDANNPR